MAFTDTSETNLSNQTGSGIALTLARRLPILILFASILVCCALLAFPMALAIGPMHWDLLIYFDAAQRIWSGQVPVTDFFVPVGPLGYYLFAGGLAVFEQANPLLLVQWSMLAVSAPVMVLVLIDVQRRSAVLALALLLPFLFFALLPFNTREYYPFPGFDAFGIYNRQTSHLLYVLTTALLFVRDQRLMGVAVTVAMTALFFVKITGFAAGGLLCAFAFAAGRVRLGTAAAISLAFLGVLIFLEAAEGLVSHYISDILALANKNSGGLLQRFVQAMSMNFGIAAAAGFLTLWLVVTEQRGIFSRWAGGADLISSASRTLDHHAFWIGVSVAAGIVFESQNTGSQAFILLFPVIVAVLADRLEPSGRLSAPLLVTIALAAATVLPPVVEVGERFARATIGGLKYETLVHENLKTAGDVRVRPVMMERVSRMREHYVEHRNAYQDLVEREELPSFIFYSEFDFQALHLTETDAAVTAIRALENRNGLRFETVMNLNFVNPFPYLLDRKATKHIAIGADPGRAVPEPGGAEFQAVSETDLILRPTCPPTTANRELHDLYRSAMAEHKRIELTPCFEAWVHPRHVDAVAKR